MRWDAGKEPGRTRHAWNSDVSQHFGALIFVGVPGANRGAEPLSLKSLPAPSSVVMGEAVRIDIPGHGACILSAADPHRADFARIARADGKTLTWTTGSDRFEITSAANVLTQAEKCWWQRARGPKWQRRREPQCQRSMAAGAPPDLPGQRWQFDRPPWTRVRFTQGVERQGRSNWLGEKGAWMLPLARRRAASEDNAVPTNGAQSSSLLSAILSWNCDPS